MASGPFKDVLFLPGSGNDAHLHSILVNGGNKAANQYTNCLYLKPAIPQPTGGIPNNLDLPRFHPSGVTYVVVGA